MDEKLAVLIANSSWNLTTSTRCTMLFLKMRQLSFELDYKKQNAYVQEMMKEQNGIKNIEWTSTNQIVFTPRVDLAKVGTFEKLISMMLLPVLLSVYCLRLKTGRWNNLSWHSLMLLI